MSQALRKLTASISKSNTLVIFINQIRMKIGVMFGSPETTTGGNALKFYASVRLDIRRIGALKNGDDVVGNAHPREGREEQGGAAVQGRRVRHHVRRGHLQGRRADRPRRQGRRRREVGLLVLLRRPAHRPGPRERQELPRASIPKSPTRSRRRSARMPASSPPSSTARRKRRTTRTKRNSAQAPSAAPQDRTVP